jgi:hypothetical protein
VFHKRVLVEWVATKSRASGARDGPSFSFPAAQAVPFAGKFFCQRNWRETYPLQRLEFIERLFSEGVQQTSGTTIASNDNWQTDLGAARIQSNNLAPSDPRESATLQSLAPGNYTAIVRGNDNTTGVGLVEVYNLPNP